MASKKLSPELIEFKQEVEAKPVDDRNAMVVDLYKEIEELLAAKKEDPDIQSLKEQLKSASASYNERIGHLKSKIKIILDTLKQ